MQTRLSLKTLFKVTPQLVIASELLQATDIEGMIWREMATNPALKLAGEHVKRQERASLLGDTAGSGRQTYTANPETVMEYIAASPTSVDLLIDQVTLMINRHDLDTAIFLLYSLDDHGYLRATPKELAIELGVDTASVERVIPILHQLDPPGIGARDLNECLFIQCTHLLSEGADCGVAQRILAEAWDEFCNQRWKRISRKLKIAEEIVGQACRFISQHLYPYPLLLLDDSSVKDYSYQQADLIIHHEALHEACNYTVEVPGIDQFELRVNADFSNALQGGNKAELSSEDHDWIKAHIDRAGLFIAAFKQRWVTLRRIGEYLVSCERDFLEHGPLHFKPMTRAAVAEALGMHESTVGRAIRDKVVQLPNGRLFPLSDFFDASLAAKEAIRQVLTSEDDLLSDQEIADRLCSMGIRLARRTVTKYRQHMKIPSSHSRQANIFAMGR